jgi:hypothetical protein
MSRTTVPAIIEALGRNYDAKTPLTGFLKSANVTVNNLVTLAQQKGVAIDAETLERIECLLACHFYQRHDPDFNSKNTGRSAASFRGQAGMRFSSTMYGQDALSLDFSGILSSMEKGGRQSLVWIGKPANQQIPWVDRN